MPEKPTTADFGHRDEQDTSQQRFRIPATSNRHIVLPIEIDERSDVLSKHCNATMAEKRTHVTPINSEPVARQWLPRYWSGQRYPPSRYRQCGYQPSGAAQVLTPKGLHLRRTC